MTSRIRPQKGQRGAKINSGITVADPSPDSLPPIFSFKINQNYCLTSCTRDEQAQLALTLHQLSKSSWSSLRAAGKKGGYEIIPKTAIRGSIPSDITKDVNIIAFRFYGKAPMVGYRDAINRRVFHIIWLDRSFCLYNHGS